MPETRARGNTGPNGAIFRLSCETLEVCGVDPGVKREDFRGSDFDWLWFELSRVRHEDLSEDEDIYDRLVTPPWESPVPAVKEVWDRLTAPENREHLEARLREDCNPYAEEVARKALEICLERDASIFPDPPPRPKHHERSAPEF